MDQLSLKGVHAMDQKGQDPLFNLLAAAAAIPIGYMDGMTLLTPVSVANCVHIY